MTATTNDNAAIGADDEDGDCGTINISYQIIRTDKDLSRAKVSGKIADQAYDGGILSLSDDDFYGLTVKLDGKELKLSEDYYCLEDWTSIPKKGTAKVTLRPISGSGYGGEKTVSVKINARSVSWKKGGMVWRNGQWTDVE